ncbi:MAG: 50S ribosomal protein L31e [Halobacteriota archaeon]|nr:50S ribosomal protein L31e [Halobacteriota archaeon]
MSEEQIYTIPLRRAKSVPRWKRSNRAITEVRDYLSRHTKAEEIKLDPEISEKIWERGSEKPPSRIRVKVTKDEDGVLEAKLA